MKLSHEEIGQWCATFACSGVSEGDVVAASGNSTVSACEAGDVFCGVAAAVSRTGDACSVQLGGLVTVSYSGDDVPEIGYNELVADGDGGVAVAGEDDVGREYLVIAVDSTAGTAVIKL